MSDKAGKEMFEEVMNFFNEAEAAIEAKDLDKLMALYSEGYTNGVHKKVDISLAWKRLFKDFGGLAMTHNMHLSMHDAKTNVAVMTCSGILVGVPTGDKESIALDYWMNNDHVLVKEGGKWKILGSIGAEKKRLWFDKPLHPLF
jgi:ketosteroid isomerase-like protein